MQARPVRGAIGAAIAVAAVTIVVNPGPAVASVSPPQSDRFYRPPAHLAGKAPGAILRSRPVQLAAFAALPQNVQAWQVMFRSTSYAGSLALYKIYGAAAGFVNTNR